MLTSLGRAAEAMLGGIHEPRSIVVSPMLAQRPPQPPFQVERGRKKRSRPHPRILSPTRGKQHF